MYLHKLHPSSHTTSPPGEWRSVNSNINIKDTAHRQTNRIQPKIIPNISELDCYANQNSMNYNLHKKREVFICSILVPKVSNILYLKDCYTSNRYFASLYSLRSLQPKRRIRTNFSIRISHKGRHRERRTFFTKKEEKMGIGRK